MRGTHCELWDYFIFGTGWLIIYSFIGISKQC